MRLFNEKLSDLRRELYQTTKDGLEKNVLKGTCWLLLKRPGNLDASRHEPQRLEEALRLIAPLATAYYDHAISTGRLKGTNKIKTMKRQAYGIRDHQFFILIIYAIHESRYVLGG
jgi:transposase